MTSGEREALDQLTPELENIVQALRGCERLPDGPELGLRLVAALGQYWLSLGLLELGYRLTNEALSMGEAQGPSQARDRANECLALARLLHDDHIAAGVLAHLGGLTFELGDPEPGLVFLEESLRLARERADTVQVCRALSVLGEAHCALGHCELGPALLEECLQIGRDQGDPHSVAFVACNLARNYLSFGEVKRAWPLILEALDLSSRTKSKLMMQMVVDVVTAFAVAAGDWPAAARMLGAADAALKLVGNKRNYANPQFWPSLVGSIRNSLRAVDFDAAYDAGHALPLEQAIEEARAWLEKSPPAA